MYSLYINLLVAFNLFSSDMNNPSSWYVARCKFWFCFWCGSCDKIWNWSFQEIFFFLSYTLVVIDRNEFSRKFSIIGEIVYFSSNKKMHQILHKRGIAQFNTHIHNIFTQFLRSAKFGEIRTVWFEFLRYYVDDVRLAFGDNECVCNRDRWAD